MTFICLVRPQEFASAHCDHQNAKISLSTWSFFSCDFSSVRILRGATVTFCVIMNHVYHDGSLLLRR